MASPFEALVCLDKKVRTGLSEDAGTALEVSLSWAPAVDYEAVVLVMKNATRWRITPTGGAEQTAPRTDTDKPGDFFVDDTVPF